MSNPENQKDFFTWWKEVFAPLVAAARKLLEAHIQKWQEFSKETLELWAQFAKVYTQLEPYIKNISAGLNDPDFEIANDVVEMAHIFDAIDLEKTPEAVSLMSVISTELFQKSLNEFYSNLSLDQRRLPLIQEAMLLHNQGHYGGSICLLYGLVEGVLTESFEKANYIIINSNRINPVEPDGTTNTRQNLTGLAPKLDHAIRHQDRLSAYYAKIKSYELVNGDPQQTIPKTRNNILHGGSLDFNTEKRSAQLIMWLYSALLHIQTLGFNNSIQPTANASAN